MKEIEHTNRLVSHRPENPYEGKRFFVRTIIPTGMEIDKEIIDKEIQITNPIEFSAALEEIAQFNNEKENQKQGITQKLITL